VEEEEIDWEAESSFFDDPHDNCPPNTNAADEPPIICVVPDALVGGCDYFEGEGEITDATQEEIESITCGVENGNTSIKYSDFYDNSVMDIYLKPIHDRVKCEVSSRQKGLGNKWLTQLLVLNESTVVCCLLEFNIQFGTYIRFRQSMYVPN
jgi:hypothetical protein